MPNQRGFVSVGILIAILSALAILGAGAYFVVHQQSPAQTSLDNVQTLPRPNDQAQNGDTKIITPSHTKPTQISDTKPLNVLPTLAPEYASEKLTVTVTTDKKSYVGNNLSMTVSWSVQGFPNGKVPSAHTLEFCQERVDESLPLGHETACHSADLQSVVGTHEDIAECVNLISDSDKPTITCRMKVSVLVPVQCPPAQGDMPPLCPDKVVATGYTEPYAVTDQDAYAAFQTSR